MQSRSDQRRHQTRSGPVTLSSQRGEGKSSDVVDRERCLRPHKVPGDALRWLDRPSVSFHRDITEMEPSLRTGSLSSWGSPKRMTEQRAAPTKEAVRFAKSRSPSSKDCSCAITAATPTSYSRGSWSNAHCLRCGAMCEITIRMVRIGTRGGNVPEPTLIRVCSGLGGVSVKPCRPGLTEVGSGMTRTMHRAAIDRRCDVRCLHAHSAEATSRNPSCLPPAVRLYGAGAVSLVPRTWRSRSARTASSSALNVASDSAVTTSWKNRATGAPLLSSRFQARVR
jgi:hypothetical protein